MSNRTRFFLYGLLTAMTVFLAVGCGSDSVSPVTTTPTASEWYQMTSLPNTAGWQTIWGLSPDTLFAVGLHGAIYRGDAAGGWTSLESGRSKIMYSVWGTSDTVHVVGDSGLVLNYDYNTFEDRDVGYDVTWFHDIWGFSDTNIFVPGDNGRILYFNGDRWNNLTGNPDEDFTDTLTLTPLYAVWGTSPENVYVVGALGACLRISVANFDPYDPTSPEITPLNSNTAASLLDIWGFSESDIYAVGNNGTIIHYDGTSWSRMASPVEIALAAVWGPSPDNVYAVGAGGTILHYDGTSWTEMDSPTQFDLITVWGPSADRIYAAGRTTVEYDGVSWKIANISEQPDFLDVWVHSTSDALAVGTGGKIDWYDGSTWASHSHISGTEEDLHGVWGDGSGSYRFAVGDNGTILRLEDPEDTVWNDISGVTSENLKAVWGIDDSTAFAVGDNGTIVEYDGVSWSTMTSNTDFNLTDVYGTSDTVMFATTDNGQVMMYDGAWQTAYPLGGAPLNSVWVEAEDDVFAVGNSGRILHFDGTIWEDQHSGTTADLLCVWGQDGNDVFAAGRDGLILQYDGSTWEPVDNKVIVDIYGFDGVNKFNMFASGGHNHLLRYLE